jgi:SulP family sulfate permease
MVAALAGIFLSFSNIIKVQTLKSKFGDFTLDILDLSYMKKISPVFFFDIRLWVDSLPIAFISVLESLISAKISDEMTHTHFNKTKEVNSLALSNIISGLFGGIPVTAALARTTLNIRSGATRKFSSLLNGVFLFLISFIFLFVFRYLPLCVAAAQVAMVAVRMVNIEEIQTLYSKDRKNFYILITIAIICIVQDPTIGIVFGILIYLISFCDSLTYPWSEIIKTHGIKVADRLNSKTESGPKIIKNNHYAIDNLNLFLSDLPSDEGEYVLYRIIGIVNFMNVKEHTEKINTLAAEDTATVVISFRYLHYIDLDAMHAIKHLIEHVSKDLRRRSFEKALKHKIIITGLTKYNLEGISDKDWIEELKNNDMLILKDHTHEKYFE